MADNDREKLVQTWFENMRNGQRAWKNRFHTEMGGEALSVGQLSLLFYLRENQPVSSKQIAADTHNSRSAVAQLLDGLDKLQMIVRQPDPADRRIAYVSLTKAGADKVRSLEERRKAFFMEMAEQLTDEELATMIRVQEKMLNSFEKRQEKK